MGAARELGRILGAIAAVGAVATALFLHVTWVPTVPPPTPAPPTTPESELAEGVRRGDLSRVQGLLDRGASPDAHMNTYDEERALHAAAGLGQVDLVLALLAHGADVRAVGRQGTALHYAAESGNVALIELLLDLGLDPNERVTTGEPPQAHALAPLLHAAASGNGGAVWALLRAGADPSLAPSALHWARTAAVVDELVAAGMDVDAVVPATEPTPTVVDALHAHRPLHPAARHGHDEVVERLVRHGAFIDAQDAWGATPLHYAVGSGRRTTVALLCGLGADRTLRDFQGRAAEDYRDRGRWF